MQVASRVVHLVDPVPPLPQPEERLLPDILDFRLAPGDGEQDPVEAELLGPEELLE